MIVFDGSLVDIGEYGIGASECEEGGFGKEPAHLCQWMFPAVDSDESSERHGPQPDTNPKMRPEGGPRKTSVIRNGRVIVDNSRLVAFLRGAMTAPDSEILRVPAAA